jgi:hypothetical protein
MSDFFKAFTDAYERKARLSPMLLVFLPVALILVLCVDLSLQFSLKSVSAAMLYLAVSSWLSSFARYRGKALEEKLKKQWGGWPSMTILRHRDPTIDSITKANIHKSLSKLVAGTASPTPAEELEAPQAADEVYTAWSEHLRKVARNDSKKYPHVSAENAAYGFQRNMMGVKPYGIGASLLAAGILGFSSWQAWSLTHTIPKLELTGSAFSLVLLLMWLGFVNRRSVKQAATDYGRRLIDDCIPQTTTRKAKTA